jgi:hypothetical protein
MACDAAAGLINTHLWLDVDVVHLHTTHMPCGSIRGSDLYAQHMSCRKKRNGTEQSCGYDNNNMSVGFIELACDM